MASNDCGAQTICVDGVELFYEGILTKIEDNMTEIQNTMIEIEDNKKLLNEERISKVSWLEWVVSWSILPVNLDRIKSSLNKLKEEVQTGKELYKRVFKLFDDVSSKQDDFEKHLKEKETPDNLQLRIYFEGFISSFHSERDKLSKTFTELKLKVTQEETQPTSAKRDEDKMTVSSALCRFGFSLACNQSYKQGESKEEQKSEKVEKLLKNEVLDKLQVHHCILSQLIGRMEMHHKELDAFLQDHNTTQDVNGISDSDVVKARIMYCMTEHEELNELKSEEPDMSEEMRQGAATRAAVRSCKTFFKKLNYSDSQVDEFIKGLQS